MLEQIKNRLQNIYGEKITDELFEKYTEVFEKHRRPQFRKTLWDESDVFLITYGDSILKDGERPLQTLHHFVKEKLMKAISIVHILPFFPYSSDDGFSVIDFNKVDPELGTWDDINAITKDFRMMADLVVNHISAKSEWMQQFQKNEAPGKDFILTVDEDFDTSNVVRPRSSPVLTEFETTEGPRKAWTTFSDDQIDLNYNNPELMLAMVDILLSYINKGVSVIRLDAIAFLWKRSGTSCLHEEETHEAVKVMRDIFDYCVPGSVLLTETNVPHLENISYFGKGDEAHMVYQFALPPLLLHALHTGNATYLTQWAKTLENPGKDMTYFNFTASHDGVGVRPLEGLLPDEEKTALFDKMKDFGARINTRRTTEGKDVPYELNITYYDALSGTQEGKDEFQTYRFISSQMIMMALQGVPAVYIHSLLGTHNYQEGVAETGQNRTINRRKWKTDEITPLLEDENTDHAQVFNELTRVLNVRRLQKAFHPSAPQEIINLGPEYFVIVRNSPEHSEEVICITNMTDKVMEPHFKAFDGIHVDLITGKSVDINTISLKPYQTMWLFS